LEGFVCDDWVESNWAILRQYSFLSCSSHCALSHPKWSFSITAVCLRYFYIALKKEGKRECGPFKSFSFWDHATYLPKSGNSFSSSVS